MGKIRQKLIGKILRVLKVILGVYRGLIVIGLLRLMGPVIWGVI